MGEAKIRGTREERVAQAIGRKQLERESARLAAEARAAAHQAWLTTLSPEQRAELDRLVEQIRMHNATLAGLMAGTIGAIVP